MNTLAMLTTTLTWIVQGFFFGIGIIAATDLVVYLKPRVKAKLQRFL
jgi:hypothetical protein